MNRNLSLQEKTEKLLNNSFQSLDRSIREGHRQITRDRYEEFRDEIIAIMEQFQHRKVYVLDLPANIIPHPETRRRLVDPQLINTPPSKTIVVETVRFDSLYELTERFNQLLEQNNEIFIYVIESVQFFSPTSFEPEHKPIVRFAYINLDYWYNPQYIQPLIYERGFETPNTNNGVVDENRPKSIGDSILIHKF